MDETVSLPALKQAKASGLLNWIKKERRSIQLFSSLNWTELNEVNILNVERWTEKSGKNIQFSSQYIRGHKMQKNLQKGDKIFKKLNKMFIYL